MLDDGFTPSSSQTTLVARAEAEDDPLAGLALQAEDYGVGRDEGDLTGDHADAAARQAARAAQVEPPDPRSPGGLHELRLHTILSAPAHGYGRGAAAGRERCGLAVDHDLPRAALDLELARPGQATAGRCRIQRVDGEARRRHLHLEVP